MPLPGGRLTLVEIASMRRQAVSSLIVALALLGVSIFLISAARASVLTIFLTVTIGGYSGYLFWKVRQAERQM